jgi:hypothetical protein
MMEEIGLMLCAGGVLAALVDAVMEHKRKTQNRRLPEVKDRLREV